MTTCWQVTYPNTPRDSLITRGLFPFLLAAVLVMLAFEALRSGPARKVS